uniref:NADH-ubiquinone oxidoreductase chain 4 n=1 Tax=Macoma balthica TaxID=1903275 RepID=A0A6H2U2W1_MACBL|nr:NADH dehydrogenase subunit 4 [Macoma balthica]
MVESKSRCYEEGQFWVSLVMGLITCFWSKLGSWLAFDVDGVEMSSQFMSFDFLSVLMTMLTSFIVLLSLAGEVDNYDVDKGWAEFGSLMVCLLIVGSLFFFSSRVFLLLFYFESSMVPVLCLVLGWGLQPERLQAATYMVVYTICGSLPLLMALCSVVDTLGTDVMGVLMLISSKGLLFPENVLMMMLISPMLVKIPVYFVHSWLPKAHVEAPISGSMILAGVMLKMGLYGLCRMLSVFGFLSSGLSTVLMSVCIIGGLICSLTCFCIYDVKMIIAYSSITHMGLSVAGVVSGLPVGWSGGLCMGLAHGVCSPALFMLSGLVYSICGSRSVLLCGGVLSGVPVVSGLLFFYCCLNLGAPPSLSFYGEILIYCSVMGVLSYCGTIILGMSSLVAGSYSVVLYSKVNHGMGSSFLYSDGSFSVRWVYTVFLGLPVLVFGSLYLDLFLN